MNLARSLPLAAFAPLTCAVVALRAHPVSFISTITYSASHLPFPVHLEPNTTYGFDVSIGDGHFE